MALLTGVLRGLMDLVFPPECRVCGDEMAPGGDPISLCDTCEAGLRTIPKERCPKCGKVNLKRAAAGAARTQCRECQSGTRRFDVAVSAFLYGGTFRKLWHRVKFSNRPDWIPSIVESALEKIGPEEEFNPYLFDLYTWVPTSERRRQERGFDPAEEISRHLSEKYKRPHMALLRRIRDTRPQFELSRKDRIKNVEGAFAAAIPRDQRVRAVLLVDDILTTGATASACAAALKDRGAQKVVLFALARGG
ncbi:MAG: hypothetical protein A3G34_09690 [Candidatus Lindowbacteria bacterium RIFCSPLOWO2_12_FULL_62_27]|nr:MAG: hypothetical protein A3G34_09690 [Candidatus Lindowbacteria bacterium RIFCSPLOWO2_12_FULL_62_27]OGH61517.1 MAG: hypothetical protein A3I06_02690 [Candidatus Lindowbacteria bacterium RIFCSPLOWO2_02_FULL_62_12]